jgi:hypothetical protein
MTKTQKEIENRLVFTTEKVDEIKQKNEDGYKITRFEKYWYANFQQVRRANLNFVLNEEETLEYTKCMLGIDSNGLPYLDPNTQIKGISGVQYFAENFCKIKTELGEVKNMKLRDYQLDILDMYTDNRFSVLASSRQSGKCLSISAMCNIDGVELPIYKIWYKSLEKPTIYQSIKYRIYQLIDYLN